MSTQPDYKKLSKAAEKRLITMRPRLQNCMVDRRVAPDTDVLVVYYNTDECQDMQSIEMPLDQNGMPAAPSSD